MWHLLSPGWALRNGTPVLPWTPRNSYEFQIIKSFDWLFHQIFAIPDVFYLHVSRHLLLLNSLAWRRISCRWDMSSCALQSYRAAHFKYSLIGLHFLEEKWLNFLQRKKTLVPFIWYILFLYSDELKNILKINMRVLGQISSLRIRT